MSLPLERAGEARERGLADHGGRRPWVTSRLRLEGGSKQGAEGKHSVAHRGFNETGVELGEAGTMENQRRRSSVAEEGNGGAGGIQGFRRLPSW